MFPQDRAEPDAQTGSVGRLWRDEDDGAPVLLFVHLPRTAGTTLNGILSRQYRGEAFLKLRSGFAMHNDQIVIGANPLEGLAASQVSRLRAVSGHMSVGLHRLLSRPARYVTVLRDPIDRVSSLYRYIMATPTHRLHEWFRRDLLTLKDCLVQPFPQFNNGQLRMITGLAGFDQLPHGVTDPALIDKARQILDQHFDLVGATEYFDEFLVLAWQRYHWQTPLYRRSNVSSNGEPAVDEETRALARQMNVMDEALHAYAVERMSRAITEAGPAFQERLAVFTLLNDAGGRT